MIHALLILDQSGNLIYSWKYEKARREVIKKFVPELIGSFITAMLKFGSEILNVPRYIDMGVAGVAIVNINVGRRTLIAVAIADKDDSARSIELFIADFKRRAEGILTAILSISETGFVIISEEVEKLLNDALIEALRRHIRFLPAIRSDDKKSFLLSTVVSTFTYYVLNAVVALATFYLLLDVLSLSEADANALFLIVWIFYMIALGLFTGWLSCRPKSAFFSAIIAYTAAWLIYAIANYSSLTVIIGGSLYSVIVGISAYTSAIYFDDKYLTTKN